MSHLSPDELTRERSSRPIWILTFALLTLIGVAGAGFALVTSRQSTTVPQVSASTNHDVAAAAPVTTAPSLPQEVTSPATRQNSIERLLRDRADALLLGDVSSWRDEQVLDAAVPDFASIHNLAPVSYEYSVTSITSSGDPTQAAVSALIRYRLPMDAAAATFREDLALQHTDTGWRIVSEHSIGRKPVWELGAISQLIGKHVTVIGIDQTSATLQRYASIADAVIPDVTRAWGSDWAQRLIIVVPKTIQQVETGLGRSVESLRDIAAVTSMETASGDQGSPRIWLNTPTMQGLSSLGREIVLRHEVVHVATGSGSTDATPLWLEEGLAEYIGYENTGVSRAVAAGDAIDALRDGHKFTALPTADDFSGAGLAIAYEGALIACDELADDGGLASLVKTYRLTAQGTGSSDENVAAAIHQVYGLSLDEFILHWDARLHQLAGLPFTQEEAVDAQSSAQPSSSSSMQPSSAPSARPTATPSTLPTARPTSQPTVRSSASPSTQPSSRSSG